MSQWLIDRHGVQVTITAATDEAQQLAWTAIKDIRPQEVSEPVGVEIVIDQVMNKNGDELVWQIEDRSNNLKRQLTHPGDIIYHLTDRMVFHIADKVENVHCLHSGAVSFDSKAIVIPATSGSGKSSFTAWLVTNGFSYLSDELNLIDSDRNVSGLSRPIQIKPHGIEGIKPLLVDPELLYFGNTANALPPEAFGGQVCDADDLKLSMMIFPKYQKDSDFEFARLSSAEAGMSLMSNHVNARNIKGHGFRAMMAIIRETPCYSLEYGGFDKLPDDFVETLKNALNA